MAATYVNFDIDQGTDFSITVNLKDDLGQPFNLTGYTIAAQMRKNYASSSATTFATSHDSTGGHIILSLDNSVTGLITPGNYLYDVEITDGSLKKTRVIEGIVTVTPGITRI